MKIEHKRARAITIKSGTIIYHLTICGFIAMPESRYTHQMLSVSQKGFVNEWAAHAIRPVALIQPAKALVDALVEI